MKVISSKATQQGQPAIPTESTSVSSPSDFSNIVMQQEIALNSSSADKKPNAGEAEDLLNETDSPIATTEDSLSNAIDPILLQLNLSTLPDKPNLNIKENRPDISLTEKAPSKELSMVENPIVKAMTQQDKTAIKEMDYDTALSDLDKNLLMSQMSQMPQIPKTDIKPEAAINTQLPDAEEVLETDGLSAALKESFNSKMLPFPQNMDIKQVANIRNGPSQKPEATLKPFIPLGINSLNKTANIELTNAEKTLQTTNINSLKSLLPSVEGKNKYNEVFNQLGQMISSQTANVPDAKIATDSNFKNQYIDNLKDFQMHSDTHVEITSYAVNGLKQESYDAKIKIYPPELGPVLANLKVDKNSADLVIWAQNNHVAALIESNLGHLKEKFAQSDINLNSIQVQTLQGQEQQSDTKGQQNNNRNNESLIDSAGLNVSENTIKRAPKGSSQSPNTIIDTYA
jgi:flagellar hook-length control protein FliK